MLEGSQVATRRHLARGASRPRAVIGGPGPAGWRLHPGRPGAGGGLGGALGSRAEQESPERWLDVQSEKVEKPIFRARARPRGCSPRP